MTDTMFQNLRDKYVAGDYIGVREIVTELVSMDMSDNIKGIARSILFDLNYYLAYDKSVVERSTRIWINSGSAVLYGIVCLLLVFPSQPVIGAAFYILGLLYSAYGAWVRWSNFPLRRIKKRIGFMIDQLYVWTATERLMNSDSKVL